MPHQIDALLHRRPDLSTFLVHLTAASTTETPTDPEQNLISILTGRRIEARNPYGLLRNYARDNAQTNPALWQSQLVVCLTETPLEHVWMMCEDIAGRGHPLAPQGLAFSKPWARSVGANPVWYVDVQRRGGWDWLTVPMMNLVKQAVQEGAKTYASPFDLDDGAPPYTGLPLDQSPIAQIAPFIETMGPVDNPPRRKEFWWEREWQYRQDLTFQWSEVVAVFAPELRHDILKTTLAPVVGMENIPSILDPTWGLERMIAALTNVPAEFAGPIPRY